MKLVMMHWAETEVMLVMRYPRILSYDAGAVNWGLCTCLSSASLLQPKTEQGRVQMVCHLERVASKHMGRNHRCSLLSHHI